MILHWFPPLSRKPKPGTALIPITAFRLHRQSQDNRQFCIPTRNITTQTVPVAQFPLPKRIVCRTPWSAPVALVIPCVWGFKTPSPIQREQPKGMNMQQVHVSLGKASGSRCLAALRSLPGFAHKTGYMLFNADAATRSCWSCCTAACAWPRSMPCSGGLDQFHQQIAAHFDPDFVQFVQLAQQTTPCRSWI